MRQNDNTKEVRTEGGNQQLARGNALGCLFTAHFGDRHHEVTSMLTRLSMIANPYIQGKSFYRS